MRESPYPSSSDGAAGPPEPNADPITPTGLLDNVVTQVWVTPAIVAVNALVFVAMVVTGVSPSSPTSLDLFRWGADYGPATVGGQWWRLVSSAFVHVGLLHIALNMYVLWRAGALAERLFGRAAFLTLYLFAAIGGSLASVLWSPLTVSAGASGAIFGVYGAILAFSRVAKDALPAEAVAGLQKGAAGFVIYNVMFGLVMPNVSNSAHLGGLATGLIAGWLIAPEMRGPGGVDAEGMNRHLRSALLVPILAALAWGAHVRITSLPAVKAQQFADEARALMDTKDWGKARVRLDEAIRLDPGNGFYYVLRGWVREAASDRMGAISDYGDAIQRNLSVPTPLVRRCLALYRQRDYDRAMADCDAAIALDATNAEAWHGRAEILKSKRLDEDAAKAADRLAQLSPNWSHAHLLLAELLTRNGDLAAADSEIRKASALAPDEPENASARADLLLRQGDYRGAQHEADRAVSLAPKAAWVYSARAEVFRAQRDFEKALADLDYAVKLDPNEGSWHNGRAWTLLQLGRLPEAMVAIEHALSLEPGSAYALGTRCWVRAAAGDHRAARADCDQATKLLPGNDLDRGMVGFLNGHYADAVAAWRKWAMKNRADTALLGVWIAKAEAAGRTASRDQ
jgi:membrane associated rhomboid family serine protease/Flp pilus assembly protein TadD